VSAVAPVADEGRLGPPRPSKRAGGAVNDILIVTMGGAKGCNVGACDLSAKPDAARPIRRHALHPERFDAIAKGAMSKGNAIVDDANHDKRF